MKYTVVISI